MKPNRISLRRARGVTLIEVLVTLVIVAVGLLGLAGMQVRGLSIQKDAHGRAIATQLALDIADRMRSNAGALGGYTFTGTYPTAAPTLPTAPNCKTAVCTAGDQATFDVARWLDRVRNSALPGGWARIEPDPAGSTARIITVMWVETGPDRTRNCPSGASASVECISVRVLP